ncbi:hypothetical protein KKB40_01360 [Patescibacteria group bacterium]|nr:hypothetical protein [Patescibacteria group bacterium]
MVSSKQMRMSQPVFSATETKFAVESCGEPAEFVDKVCSLLRSRQPALEPACQ